MNRGEGGNGGGENESIRLFYNISAYYGLLDAFAFARRGEADARDPRSAPALPAILPLSAAADAEWLSPAQAALRGSALPAPLQRELSLLTRAAAAYGDNWAEFDQALAEFDRSVRGRLGPEAVGSGKISLEIVYNRLDPFAKAEIAYGAALLLLLLALVFQRLLLERLSALLIFLGFLAHTFGLAARMLIMGRPPVTNLYETFIFVAWTAVIMGLVMSGLQKQGLGLLAGGLAGLVFLVIAGRYGMDGDTMGMLAAVLDSNLWLATHVVTIALGYAGCVVAGVIGHVVIVQELLRQRSAAVAATSRSLYAVLGFGLVFTSIGTLMGGIWADQSWGRFWGWDPKENGALLIIIWLAVLFHARLAGWIGHVGLAVGGIGATIAVVLAWFGVNLLGVGLHAYGFTSGAARGLLAFTFIELAFIAVALPLIRKRKSGLARGCKDILPPKVILEVIYKYHGGGKMRIAYLPTGRNVLVMLAAAAISLQPGCRSAQAIPGQRLALNDTQQEDFSKQITSQLFENGMMVGVGNDDRCLYIFFTPDIRHRQRPPGRAQLTLWLDEAGGKAKTLGLVHISGLAGKTIPPPSPAPETDKENFSRPAANGSAPALLKIVDRGRGKEFFISSDGSQGPAVRLAADWGDFAYQWRIPFRGRATGRG